MKKIKIERPLLMFSIGAAIIATILFLYGWLAIRGFGFPDGPGTFGDTFGVVNAAFTGLTIIGLVITIAMQKQNSYENKQAQDEQSKLVKLQMANENFNFYLDELEKNIVRDAPHITNVVTRFKEICLNKFRNNPNKELHTDEVWKVFENDIEALYAHLSLLGHILEYIAAEYPNLEENDRLLTMRRLVLINRIPDEYIIFVASYSLLSPPFFSLFLPYTKFAFHKLTKDSESSEMAAFLEYQFDEKATVISSSK